MSNVKLVVFNNGMQLVGDYVGANADTNKVTINKPVQLIMVPKQNPQQEGQVGIAFAPFCQFTEEWEKGGVEFSPVDVLCVLTPERELVNHYNKSYGSGLVLPPTVGQV